MAIFIIDQFSLNTDLPLDVRYVPGLGRFDPDISIYKFPGMQVYDVSTESVWHTDNSLNWVEVGTGSDASLNDIYNILNIIDASIGDIYNNLSIIDSSIANLEIRVSSLESSVAYLDSSVNQLFVGQAQQDASIIDLRIEIAQLDASIIRIDNYQTIQDVSILLGLNGINSLEASIVRIDNDVSIINNNITIIDGSITYIDLYQGIQDASILSNENGISQLDASIVNINIYQGIQDASILALDSSLGDYVLKAGDTMTGPLNITGGGLQVGTIGSPQDVSIYSQLYVHNGATIGGDLVVDGSLFITNVESIDVSSAFIVLNTGLTGTPPASLQSGIIVERGDLEPYVFIFDESTQSFRIGISAKDSSISFADASTQSVATREDSPLNQGVAYWNSTLSRFDTSAGLTFTPESGNLTLDGSLILSTYVGSIGEALVVGAGGIIETAIIPDVSNLATFAYVDGSLSARDVSIAYLDNQIIIINNYQSIQDSSISTNEASIGVINNTLISIDASIIQIDASINELYTLDASNIKGGINVGDGSAQVFRDVSNGLLTFREIAGVGAAVVTENGNVIEISIDASFAGEVNTGSNIGSGEGVFAQKTSQDLEFKSIKAINPSEVIITSDASQVYIDVSVAAIVDASLVGLTDTSINVASYANHQILEFTDNSIWENTDNIWWDTSLGTTTDDLGGVPAGTDLNNLTLKEILFKILYEYQIPVLSASSSPVGGTFEKGALATQFSSIDISYVTANTNYPLALLNNVAITKTGSGTIFDASLGLVASDSSTYTDGAGITNWGGLNRTITYQVEIDDDQSDQSQPATIDQVGFTFYYPERWGIVPKNTNVGGVTSSMILGLDSSILQGQTDLTATFDNSLEAQIHYLFAYPDTIAAPDNFGSLADIIDQNGYNVTGSFSTSTTDVSTDGGNVRYRFYLLDNWVDTSTFDITFKF